MRSLLAFAAGVTVGVVIALWLVWWREPWDATWPDVPRETS